MKRIFWSLLTVCMLAAVMTVGALAADLTIGTVKELQAFAEKVNGGEKFKGQTVELSADIDLAGIEWTPIGGDSVYFAGEFDGNGHTISNLTQTTGARMGLFGLVEYAYFHDFTLRDVSFTVSADSSRVGALAGNLQYWNVVENVTIDGIEITVNGNDGLIGAVAGYVWKSQCGNVDVKNAEITINGTGNVFGGNTGYGRAHIWDTGVTGNNAHWLDGTVQNISGTEYVLQNYYVDCDVENIKIILNGTGSEVGGFFGSDAYNNHSNYFVDCHITGLDVTAAEGTSQIVGGFIAWNNGTTSAGTVKGFDGCSVSGTISGAKGTYGGFAGQVGGRACEYNNATANVDITCTGVAGGFVGTTQAYSTHKYTFNDCEANGDITGTVAGGFTGKNGLSGDGKSVYVDYNYCTANGKVTGTSIAGGFIGEVNPELPASNWNTVDSTGVLNITGCTYSSDTTGEENVGILIGYMDGVANGDAKEGNTIKVTVLTKPDENAAEHGYINWSEDTIENDIDVTTAEASVEDNGKEMLFKTTDDALNAVITGSEDAVLTLFKETTPEELQQLVADKNMIYVEIEDGVWVIVKDRDITVYFINSGIASVKIPVANKIDRPNDPERDGYEFAGWYADSAFKEEFNFDKILLHDTDVFAMWTVDTDSGYGLFTSSLRMLFTQRYYITVKATEGGIVTSKSGSDMVTYDRSITYTITPDEGYRIADVLYNGESAGAVTEFTAKRVKADGVLEVVFELIPVEEETEETTETTATESAEETEVA